MTKDLYIYNIQNRLASKKFWEKGLVNFSSLLLSAAHCADGVLSAWQAGKRKPQLRKGLHLGKGLAHCGLQFLPPGSSPDFPLQMDHHLWHSPRCFWPVFYHSHKKQTTVCILCLYPFVGPRACRLSSLHPHLVKRVESQYLLPHLEHKS